MNKALRRSLLSLAMSSAAIATAIGGARSAGAAVPTSNGTFPVSIHAANGTVRLSSRPTAIVSLSSTATEMLYAIGAGRQVKAVDEYSDYPPQAPKTGLDGNQPNVEAIAAYQPDLVVVAGDTTGLTKQLGKLGIPVLSEPAAATLDQAYQQYLQLGEATGQLPQAKVEVTSVRSQIAQIVASTPKPTKGATYYYELDPTYYSVTSSTFIGRVLGLIGLKSIADGAKGGASSGGYPQLNAEFIVKSNPDYIFLADTICCAQTEETVATRPGWSNLHAVSTGRVVPLNDNIASRWGPRIVVLLKDAAQAVDRARSGQR